MPRHPIRAGDTVYVPGGTIHTFGPDTLIFEVQQTSDLGQFVTPTDLYGEPLDEETWDANINAALDELKTDYLPRPNPGLIVEDGPNRRVVCCAGPHFALERWTLREMRVEPSNPEHCITLSNVGGPVRLEYPGGTERLCWKTARTCSWRTKRARNNCSVLLAKGRCCRPIPSATFQRRSKSARALASSSETPS